MSDVLTGTSPTSMRRRARRSASSSAAAPNVLRDYALLADGERGAVIGPRGDIAWMCAPRWDSPSVFSSLIGGRGTYTVEPEHRYVWGGYYEEGSMVWRSRWVTEGGIVESREALAFPGDPHRTVLLRRVEAVTAPADVAVMLEPRTDYDRTAVHGLVRHGGVWTARCGALHLRWSGAGDARATRDGSALRLRLRLEPGQSRDLVLELSDEPLPPDAPAPGDAWSATRRAWRTAIPKAEGGLALDDARHSFAVLRGLTSRGGGMVAAATTGLPERAEAGRNYDYRYVWIRDQCIAGQAVALSGPHTLVEDALRFVGERMTEDGERLAPAYTTMGGPVPDERTLELPGYPGGSAQIGNRVNAQFQLDSLGEVLLLFAAAAGHGPLDGAQWASVVSAADAIGRRWQEPDAGMWELEPQHWTHSKLTAVAGLRAAARLAPASSGEATDWLALADSIASWASAHALDPAGHWQRHPGDRAVDAALLLPALRGAVPADDPRTVATLQTYLRELTVQGYAYRFRHDDRPLPEAEGSFLLCGFLVALSLHQQGKAVDARAWFERTLAACGPPQLYSEEYDGVQHQMRGNLPQGFVHALMLEASMGLAADDR